MPENRPAPEGETLHMLESLGSDPLYRRLCQTQECFRARLTPKPWRCGVNNRPPRFPFSTREQEAAFETWKKAYEAARRCNATYRLLETWGSGKVHADIQPVLDLHDRLSGVTENHPLA